MKDQKIAVSSFRNALNTVKPALASDVVLPIVSHFCFDGDTVYAYDGVNGIRVPMPEDAPKIRGAVPGSALLKLVASLGGSSMAISSEQGYFRIKSGRSSMKLPMLDAESFIWEASTFGEVQQEIPITAEFIEGLKLCLLTVEDTALIKHYRGITADITNGHITLYSTNNNTLSVFDVAASAIEAAEPLLLPRRFCQLLVDCCGGKEGPSEGMTLSIGDGFVAVTDPTLLEEHFFLVTSVIEGAKPSDFEEVLEHYLPKKKKAPTFPVNDSFTRALKRAVAILSDEAVKTTAVEISGTEITFRTSSSMGDVRDRVVFRDAKHAAKETVHKVVPPDLLLSAMSVCNQVHFADKVIVCSRDDMYKQLVVYCTDQQ